MLCFCRAFLRLGKGEYGEGDRFLGVRVPKTRKIAYEYVNELKLEDLNMLLQNKWHEVRFAALVVMICQYKKADANYQKLLFELYVKNIGKGINNWDLVDVSCPRIVGAYLSRPTTRLSIQTSQRGFMAKKGEHNKHILLFKI